MGLFTKKINMKNSRLPLEGTSKEHKKWLEKINKRREALKNDQGERRAIYQVRHDFYEGNQSSYTTIVGKIAKEKKGHANAVYNYVGKTAKKISYSLANNPPRITVPARKVGPQMLTQESSRAQAVEDFCDTVFKRNRFFKRAYRSAVFNQVSMGDAALKIYPVKTDEGWDLKIVNHDKMVNILVGWRGDSSDEFDFVIAETDVTIQSVEEDTGIKIPVDMALKTKDQGITISGSHETGQEWGTNKGGTKSILPIGKNRLPGVTQLEYDDKNIYILIIAGKIVQFQKKDDEEFPKIKFWIIVPNIPNPGKQWSISDLDDMLDPQTEFNEAANEERDYIRVGAAQKFVAYNMSDFDPESVKTGSGGVIFVDSPDGTARFEPLKTNVNVFPTQSFLNRTRDVLYDMGVPKVTFGASGADSGRSKAIDWQSMIDLTDFKRDTWELVLDMLMEKIQRFGYFYFEEDFFLDPVSDSFVVRNAEFDWDDILPTTKADVVVNVLNKVTMGLPFKLAFKELGYKDVDAVINAMKEESQDEELMIIRSKMYQLSGGIMGAQQRAQAQLQGMEQGPPAGAPGAPDVNQAAPTMTSPQNEGSQPMAQRGGTTSFSTPAGFIARTRQNLEAAGR